ncbi:MAG: helix-turn-helix domain-containing protein [Alphaproteobacteria bacterium]|nr:helix-turn-helix domain-containing protein [Alphaproteobacteria bacterium]
MMRAGTPRPRGTIDRPMATYQNRSLERAFSILEYLGATERGLTVLEIARRTKLHRATVHRLLMVLNQLGYVYKDRVTREYWAGFHLHSFGHRTSMIARLTHHARPFLVALANEVDELVHLGALEGIQSLVCDRIATSRIVKLDRQPGEYLDAHATAVGKALLALRPE